MKPILRIILLFVIVLGGILAVVFIPGSYVDGRLTGLGIGLATGFAILLSQFVKPAKPKS